MRRTNHNPIRKSHPGRAKNLIGILTALLLAVVLTAGTPMSVIGAEGTPAFAEQHFSGDASLQAGLLCGGTLGKKQKILPAEIPLDSPSAVLMDAATGEVLFEKNPLEERSPASITKLMTLWLIFEALEKGRIHLADEVMTSEHAKSMGGSQVFLETGEIQTVETLVKCIVVASGNDASVAMAEYLSGTEEAFVGEMNQAAGRLGMEHTHFLDCCGLTTEKEHYTCAYDIALLTRQLLLKHPEILDYSGIWMEDITHKTRKGESSFTLSSTNKLLKQYEYATGLKTGSTSAAKYCLSATANKNGREMIAVIMGAPESKLRFREAKTLLEYGFNQTSLYRDEDAALEPARVRRGQGETLSLSVNRAFCCVLTNDADGKRIEKRIEMDDGITAPVKQGDVLGRLSYYLDGELLGVNDIVAAEDMEAVTYRYCSSIVFDKFML